MKIAVASCIKLQDTNPQPVWDEIRAEQPDVLLLLGDNIYLEHDGHTDPARLGQELRALYAAQMGEPHFAALLSDIERRNGQVAAIYDDHDFLGNNRYGGDVDPALCEAARAEFERAFRPRKTGNDVYHIRSAGLADIVVLDERSYRQSPAARVGRDAILGAAQWQWFEQVVASSKAKYLVVASSTTLHTFGDESWEQYPAAFDRIRRLLGSRDGTLVVSGDVHRNAVYDDSGIVEIVTSAVARNGVFFGSARRNYGVLTFDEGKVRVELRSLKVGWRFDFTISLGNWTLP